MVTPAFCTAAMGEEGFGKKLKEPQSWSSSAHGRTPCSQASFSRGISVKTGNKTNRHRVVDSQINKNVKSGKKTLGVETDRRRDGVATKWISHLGDIETYTLSTTDTDQPFR